MRCNHVQETRGAGLRQCDNWEQGRASREGGCRFSRRRRAPNSPISELRGTGKVTRPRSSPGFPRLDFQHGHLPGLLVEETANVVPEAFDIIEQCHERQLLCSRHWPRIALPTRESLGLASQERGEVYLTKVERFPSIANYLAIDARPVSQDERRGAALVASKIFERQICEITALTLPGEARRILDKDAANVFNVGVPKQSHRLAA